MMFKKSKLVLAFRILLSAITLTTISTSAYAFPKMGVSSIDEVVQALSIEEKVKIIRGTGMAIPSNGPAVGETKDRVPGAAGSTYAIERLGIPSIVLADGPAGLRIKPVREGGKDQTYYATAFPIASLLASSWDVNLIEYVGQAIGEEAKEYGADVILAPALNIHRFALGGRNFEYYSEDPLVSGKIAAAMVNGIQSKGVGTSLKHYVANNHEWNRNTIDVKVDERSLREIYLRGFEIAVKESNPWTIMSSYNKVNGEYASESTRLLTSVLRDQWDFQGLVMTDWFGGTDAVKQMVAGNDLLMPGTDNQEGEIIAAIKSGELDEKTLDRNVKRVLQLVLQSNYFKGYKYSDSPDLKRNAEIAKMAAVDGMVLLKNDNNTLPLKKNAKLSVFGNYSYSMVTGGTGSGDVNEAYVISLEEGLKQVGITTEEGLGEAYKLHIKLEEAKRPVVNHPFAEYMPKKPLDELELFSKHLIISAKKYDVALVTIGRSSGEFVDREEDDFYLTEKESKMLTLVSDVFRKAGKPVVVIMNVGGVIETASWEDKADAILLAYQPGQEAGIAIADVLLGNVNPSGKLTDTWPLALEDYPAAKGFPGKVLDPSAKPEGIMRTLPSEVIYDDGIWLGYRYFNTKNKNVAYPFGYGLSYTDFTYSDIRVSEKSFSTEITVSVTVENVGKTAGREVVQLYISAPTKEMKKPSEELRSFAKTKLLQVGESEQLSFTLNARDLASFDEKTNAWLVDAGKYVVKAGASSRDFRRKADFIVKKEISIPL
jgi:beta-glucosidase